MNSTNENRRLLLKGIGAIGTSGALAACGGGSSSSTPASTGIQYFTEPSLPVGSTEITGIRGVNNSTDVFISGINMDNTTSPTTNYGLLYRGPVLIPNVNRWNKIGPAKPIITTNGSIINSSGLNFYGPDNGATAGSIVVVGNYNLANDPSYAYGLLYRGDIAGTGTYTQINPSSLVANGSAVDTIAHSNMNGYVVGNYINDIDDFGHAFIMAIGNTPDVPSTYTYVEIPRGSLTGGSISITAYGIWYNSNLNNYTIAGGFSKVLGENGLSTGYIVDWSPTAGFSNFTPIYYNNDSSTSKVSHVEGITTDNAGGYYLSVDWADSITQSRQGAAFVEIKRNSSGGFASPTWTSFAYPGAPATSANTVFERNVLGIYLPPTPYLAVFP